MSDQSDNPDPAPTPLPPEPPASPAPQGQEADPGPRPPDRLTRVPHYDVGGNQLGVHPTQAAPLAGGPGPVQYATVRYISAYTWVYDVPGPQAAPPSRARDPQPPAGDSAAHPGDHPGPPGPGSAC
jgi:hypothetical protein